MHRWSTAGLGLVLMFTLGSAARADDCGLALAFLREGFSVVETARQTGIPSGIVVACQRATQQVIRVPSGNRHFRGAAGPPPLRAAGPPPLNAPGPPPLHAPGPPPLNA